MKLLTHLWVGIVLLSSTAALAQTPAGNNQEIQFNNADSFGASSYLRWTGSTLYLDDMGATSPFIYMRSESGDWGRIFSENYGVNLNRLVFQTGDDGDGDYSVFRNTHWSHGELDVLEIHRSFILARGGRVWSKTTQGLSKGIIHLDPETSTDYAGSAITFGASDSGNGETAQAGIYTRSDGSFGTKMYFSTTNSYATGAQTRMMIDHVGNIGIGTATPAEKLQIDNGSLYGFNSTDAFIKIKRRQGQASIKGIFDNTSGYDGHVIIDAGRTTDAIFLNHYLNSNVYIASGGGKVAIGSATASHTLDVEGDGRFKDQLELDGQSEASSTSQVNGHLILTSSQTGLVNSFGIHTDGINAHSWIQSRHKTSSATFDLSLNPRGGNVGIGTTNPTEKLEVAGTVYSREVKVEVAAGTGPDYVFEPDYDLRTLEETAAYIKTNKHLPEIPSAKEMEANGVQLGEMNMLLLKKIEELTLYILEQEKRIKKLEEK